MTEDQALVDKLKNPQLKDRAFSELIDAYQERLYWHIRKIVITHENADDVLQNTFIRVYKNIQNFEEKSSLHTWMFRIAYNESLRLLEKNKRFAFDTIDEVSSSYLKTLFDDAYFDGDELQQKLHQILATLTERQQLVFKMKYFDELNFREISEFINISENTLKSTYYTVVKIIEKKIYE